MKAVATDEWRSLRLGDLLRIKHGYAFKGEFFSSEGRYIVLTPGNFQDRGGLQSRGDKEKFYAGEVDESFILNPHDLVVVMTDLKQDAPILGSTASIPTSGVYLHNQRIGKIVDLSDDLAAGYAYYLLNSEGVRRQLRASATGSTVRHTAPDRIHSTQVMIPGPATQRKVAAVLSAYDDLIANNARRIAILEDMARTIYREWFVEFRYPGHEGVPLVESELGPIPEGWRWTSMREFAEVVDCSHAKKPLEVDGGQGLLLHVWNIGGEGRLDLAKEYRIGDSDYSAWTQRMEVTTGDCVITKTGRVGAVAQIPDGICAAMGRNMVGLRRVDAPSFLLGYLVSSTKVSEVQRLTARGTIMESLPVASVEQLRVPVPTGDLLTRYESLARPMLRLAEVLVEEVRTLGAARDLLLPRLVSGEVDVSDLDIDVGVAS